MKFAAFLWLVFIASCQAITLEIYEVFRPISLYGTDVVEKFEGEFIQAKVISQTMVVTGAQPEGLLAAIAAPHRLTGSDSYKVTEDNLLVLCGIGITPLSDGQNITVKIDLAKMKVPDEVEIPVRTVLKLAIKSIKETLKKFHTPEDEAIKVGIQIVGLNDGTAPLRDLSEKFRIGG